jgi:hypothetical protein
MVLGKIGLRGEAPEAPIFGLLEDDRIVFGLSKQRSMSTLRTYDTRTL